VSDSVKLVTPPAFVPLSEADGELVQLRVRNKGGRPRGPGKFRVPSDGLFLGSVPTECGPLSLSEVEFGDSRRVLCRRYTRCLTYAASQGWRGFSCASCRIREDLTVDEQHRDLDALIMFLHALNLGGG
jgi:hypothetical protein